MKIAIHHSDCPESFSHRWIEYCEQKGVDYKVVNAYDTDIVAQVSDCDAFMMHHLQYVPKDILSAKQLLYSLETAGIHCFPNYHTTWHFDDKVGQKYLLEAIGAPLVPSYVFYSKRDALDWIAKTSFPKVFKLRGGAGASNVWLVHTAAEARKFVRKAFGKGFPQTDRFRGLKERFRRWREGQDTFVSVLKGVGRLFILNDYAKMHNREKGYVYFQDFISGNHSDYRMKVVNGNCWGFQRLVRKGDFRASGSGNLCFDNSKIPMQLVRLSQDIAKKLQIQSAAFDFVYDKEKEKFLVVEMSYGFGYDERESENGYWDIQGTFHPEFFNPFGWMVEELVKKTE